MFSPIVNSRKTLSKYKWRRLGTEALINSLRLHRDSVILFNAGSYPSAYQLSVLSLEEFSKAKLVEHYYYSSITNEGFPHANFEQDWLKLLYMHGEKQYAFIALDEFLYPPALVDFIRSGKLDRRKQQAVYVSLERDRKNIYVAGRISVPRSIALREAKRMISWINAEFMHVHNTLAFHGHYFGIEAMDEVIRSSAAQVIFDWPHRSRTRSRKHWTAHIELHKEKWAEAERGGQSKTTQGGSRAPET